MAVFGVIGSCLGLLYPAVLILMAIYVAWAFHKHFVFDKSLRVQIASTIAVFLVSTFLFFWVRSDLERHFPLPKSALASLFDQSAGQLLVRGLKIIGNPTFRFLRQTGGTAEFVDTTIGTEEGLKKVEPSQYEQFSNPQLKDFSAAESLKLRRLSERYETPELKERTKEAWDARQQVTKDNSKKSNSEYQIFAHETKLIALVIESRAHVSIPQSDLSSHEAYQVNLHVRRGREVVLFENLSGPESAAYAADYLDFISGQLPQ
jgi:hypothetical protein